MKAKYSEERNRWKIIVPPALTGTGKRAVNYFETKEKAEAEIRRILGRGTSAVPKVTDTEHAALVLAKQMGISEQQFLAAMTHYQKTVLNVAKAGATLEQVCLAYLAHHEHEQSNRRTVYKYRSTMRRLVVDLGPNMPFVELTQEKIADIYLKRFKPGTTRRSQYANVKALVNWALENGYLGTDPMAKMKPTDKWASNNEPLGVEAFRRILFVIAGFEPIGPGQASTTRYLRLLPFYVLGGLAGMRRAEIISSYASDPVIEWGDINWSKNWIHVRHEVAKQTGADDQSRYITLEPAAAAWLKLVDKPEGRIMEISQSTLQRLNMEILELLNIDVPDNGLRNGYASWSATFRTPGEVAKEMGDLESTVKRYYIKRREPEAGRAWFAIMPTSGRKIVPMVA